MTLSEHLSSCAECRFVVESAVEAQAEEQEEAIEPRGRRTWQWMSIAAVVGAGLVGAGRWVTPVAQTQWRAYQVKTAMRDLEGELDGQKMRLIVPRLTGFAYGKKRPTYRGPSEEGDEQLFIIQSKAQKLIDLTKNDHSPTAAHRRGIGELMIGQVDAAITDLQTATSSNDAQAWNDLSAAYYVKRKYVEAYDAANHATKIDPNLSDAWFNRALAVAGIATTEPVVKYRWAKKSSPSAEYAPLEQEPLVQMIVDGKTTEVLRMTEGQRTPDAMHARAIAHLVLNQNTTAIHELTALTKARPDDVKVWSDLAAALLANHEYKQALVAARHAHDLDSLQPETLANLAAAYQRSGDAEIAAWNDYLKSDSTSKWADEARQKLRDVQESS